MSWKDRILPASIKTPDGNIYEFDFEDIESSTQKKTSTYQMADIPGSLVQDFGLGEKSYPMIMFFTGPDCDLTANDFESSIELAGICVLNHPIKGEKNVIILSFTRSDALKTAANQVVFTLAMTETILTEIPETTTQLKTQLEQKQEDLVDANSTAFSEQYNATKLQDALNSKNRLLQNVKDFKSSVGDIIQTVNDINDLVDEVSSYITENIDFLMSAPLLLAGAMQRLYNAPSRAFASVKTRINGYLPAYNAILKTPAGQNAQDKKNQLAEKTLILNCIVSSMSEVFTNPDPEGNGVYNYLTRSDAIKSAQDLKQYLIDMQDYLDNQENSTKDDDLKNKYNVPDTVSSAIKDIVSDSLKILIADSFDLRIEKIIVIDKARTIIDLCYELYGSTEIADIDFLISSNNLTGSDLIIIPVGKIIRYYV